MFRKTLISVALGTASVLALAGCTGTADATDDGTLQVVAATSVYGQIAEEIGGDAVDVTSIVTSLSQDPHSYEASARDQLTIQRADLIIENGGGYDAFIDGLIDASGSQAPVLTAVEFSQDWPGAAAHDSDEHGSDDHEHDHEHVEGFNEHVWYDLGAMADLARGLASQLGALSPDDADTFMTNATDFVAQIEQLQEELASLAEAHTDEGAFVTEPAPGSLAAAAGLVDLTPAAFSEAVEEGQDVPPATLLDALTIIESGDVSLVIANGQTGGAETTRVIEAAESNGVPVIEVTETLPDGTTYIEWMQQNIADLAAALDS